MTNAVHEDIDFRRIAAAIRYLQQHYHEQPQLPQLAAHIGLSESRTQRIFTAWAGISPKRYLQHLTAIESAALLRAGRSVLATSYAAGLSGPARLHDLMLNVHAATPGAIARGGAGVDIAWAVHATPFGDALIGVTPHGVCALHFLGPMSQEEALADVRSRWPAATLRADAHPTAEAARAIFARLEHGAAPLALVVSGTNFQLQVWRALLRIPAGSVATYADIARDIGAPTAHRAVGAAVGRNPIAVLIPCHRVVRKDGALGGYHWGAERKTALLAWDAAASEATLER